MRHLRIYDDGTLWDMILEILFKNSIYNTNYLNIVVNFKFVV